MLNEKHYAYQYLHGEADMVMGMNLIPDDKVNCAN